MMFTVTLLGYSILDLINTTNNELLNIRRWVIPNKLTFSDAKTQYIIFHRNEEMILALPDVTLAGVPLKKVTSTKFLGIHIDFQLNLKSHIRNTEAKLYEQCGLMYHLQNIFIVKTLKQVY